MGLPARALGDDETLVLLLRPHARQLLGPALLLLVTVPAWVVAGAALPPGPFREPAGWVVTGIAGLILLRGVLWPFLRWWNTVYAITDRRLLVRTGVLTRSGHDMPLSRLNDVSFSHGLLQRMLGCGTLVVESAGERGQIRLVDVPGVERVQRTLYELAERIQDPEYRMPVQGFPVTRALADLPEAPDTLEFDPTEVVPFDDPRDAGDPRRGRRRRRGQ